MDFQRIKSDINGNPRHVVHFLTLEPEGADHGALTIPADMAVAWFSKHTSANCRAWSQ